MAWRRSTRSPARPCRHITATERKAILEVFLSTWWDKTHQYAVADAIADWAQTVWPQGNWSAVKSATWLPLGTTATRCSSEKY